MRRLTTCSMILVMNLWRKDWKLPCSLKDLRYTQSISLEEDLWRNVEVEGRIHHSPVEGQIVTRVMIGARWQQQCLRNDVSRASRLLGQSWMRSSTSSRMAGEKTLKSRGCCWMRRRIVGRMNRTGWVCERESRSCELFFWNGCELTIKSRKGNRRREHVPRECFCRVQFPHMLPRYKFTLVTAFCIKSK